MNVVIVRCPDCRQSSRVSADVIGRRVGCPRCGSAFVAVPDGAASAIVVPAGQTPEPAVVYRRSEVPAISNRRARQAGLHQPRVDEVVTNPAMAHSEGEPYPQEAIATQSGGLLLALALLPQGVPLVWLGALAAGLRPPGFSFALPVAIAMGCCGLCLGLGRSRWSFGKRLGGVIALVILAYAAAAAIFIFKLDGLDRGRAVLQKGLGIPAVWQPYEPNPADLRPTDVSFQVLLPGKAEVVIQSPLSGFEMKVVRVAAPERGRPEEYVVAHGRTKDEPDWHEKVTQAIVTASRGVVRNFRAVKDGERVLSCEWEVEMPATDLGESTRLVRVVKNGYQLFYLAAEGPTVRPDTETVKQFFSSFQIMQNRRRPKGR